MASRSPFAGSATFALVSIFALGASAGAFAADDEHEGTEEAEARAFLKGKGEGSLENPIVLATEARVSALCSELQGRRSKPSASVVDRGIERKELKMKAESAARAVYRIQVDARSVRAGEYKVDDGKLPIKTDQAFMALDGAVSLSVIKHGGASFKLAPKEASDVAARIADGQIGLDVLFRVDDGGRGISACFSAPKSEAYSLRVVPLAYTLIDAASSKPIANTTTHEMKALKSWLEPGAASLRIAAHAAEGGDSEAFNLALESKRQAFEACLQPVLQSSDATAVLGFSARVAPNGTVSNIHLQVEAIDHPEAIACVEKVLASASGPKSSKGSDAMVTIAVEREAAD
jgi:hypothetical protein